MHAVHIYIYIYSIHTYISCTHIHTHIIYIHTHIIYICMYLYTRINIYSTFFNIGFGYGMAADGTR